MATKKVFLIGGIVRELSFVEFKKIVNDNYTNCRIELIWFSAQYNTVNNILEL